MPETPAEERARILFGAAIQAHIKDHWARIGRPLNASNLEAAANVDTLRRQHGITDAEITAFRQTNKAEFDRLAAIQA
ncbi:hypothetical protein [Streptomyces goshikiensis]|uniref:hypothetical protein n=1 Tax=Streptomyces goshikiensis TaxID=1942 RepID=UPI0036A2573C